MSYIDDMDLDVFYLFTYICLSCILSFMYLLLLFFLFYIYILLLFANMSRLLKFAER